MTMQLRDPYLVAAWPGMGSVALAAASYLVSKLEAKTIEEVPPENYFDVSAVVIEGGVISRVRFPRSVFFGWKSPSSGGRDLLLFVSEAQPTWRGHEYCDRVLDVAARHGVQQIFTFAAAPTPIHPRAKPRVLAATNDRTLLPRVREEGLSVLEEGQISGLNGVLLGSALARGLPGLCLLGEIPFYAVGVPNPKASLAVLEVFGQLTGIEIDFTELREQSRAVEEGLVQLLEQAQAAGAAPPQSDDETPSFTPPSVEEDAEARITPAVRKRIEELFRRAQTDRSLALILKQELDRHGCFKEYEDRFLDLFKKGERS